MARRSTFRLWLGFVAFCGVVVLLAALAVLLTGHGLLFRETVSENRLSCRYLTIRGVVAKEFWYGDVNFGRWRCALVTDPDKLY